MPISLFSRRRPAKFGSIPAIVMEALLAMGAEEMHVCRH